jgi:hypothetical protein
LNESDAAPALPIECRNELMDAHAIIAALEQPLQRAHAIHAAVLAIAPFERTSGILARACMSAELVSVGQGRVIIPATDINAYRIAVKRYREGGDFRGLLDVCTRAHAAA